MAFFDEVKDDIDSYLRRFERYAAAQKWAVETWAVNLSALLLDRALDVYALLPQDQALNYEALKTSLLKQFERRKIGFVIGFVSVDQRHVRLSLNFRFVWEAT